MSAGHRPRGRRYEEVGLESYAVSIKKKQNLKNVKTSSKFFWGGAAVGADHSVPYSAVEVTQST